MWNFGHQTPRWYWWEKQPNLSPKSAFINFNTHHVPNVDFGDKECCWNNWVLVTNSCHHYHLEFKVLEDSRISYFRMFGMTILIFIVFWSEKKYKKKKAYFLEVTIDTFVGCPLFLFSVLPLQLYFAFPGSRT